MLSGAELQSMGSSSSSEALVYASDSDAPLIVAQTTPAPSPPGCIRSCVASYFQSFKGLTGGQIATWPKKIEKRINGSLTRG